MYANREKNTAKAIRKSSVSAVLMSISHAPTDAKMVYATPRKNAKTLILRPVPAIRSFIVPAE